MPNINCIKFNNDLSILELFYWRKKQIRIPIELTDWTFKHVVASNVHLFIRNGKNEIDFLGAQSSRSSTNVYQCVKMMAN